MKNSSGSHSPQASKCYQGLSKPFSRECELEVSTVLGDREMHADLERDDNYLDDFPSSTMTDISYKVISILNSNVSKSWKAND